jgi:hypothetical protein
MLYLRNDSVQLNRIISAEFEVENNLILVTSLPSLYLLSLSPASDENLCSSQNSRSSRKTAHQSHQSTSDEDGLACGLPLVSAAERKQHWPLTASLFAFAESQ